ncbi:MAG: homoserine dehydrogenase [Actinomycetota bacterium]|nr:homoserine dehydrogenase [Actinomycetota bacterium]
MTSAPSRTVRIGVLGGGTVAAPVVGLLRERAADLAVQAGARLEVVAVAVADVAKQRPDAVPGALVTGDATAVVADPTVDVVVELIGGVDVAGPLVRAALEAGKPVVTANKALLASPEGARLRSLARSRGVDLLYEAAVAGAIPLVRALRQSLTGERIVRVMGIVNGTTNYLLTKMDEGDEPYEAVLAEAQRLGLAERDPTADVAGYDAAAKAAILAGVAFGYDVSVDQVHCEGITSIEQPDVAFARRSGHVIKLLAVVERLGVGSVSVRVHPTLVSRHHPLAGVRDAFNAVFVEGEAAGELMLYGQGAGGLPTASAVVGDVIDAARNLLSGTTAPTPERSPVHLEPLEGLRSRYYVRLDVEDRPGVLGAVATAFGHHGVSISSMEQETPERLADEEGAAGRDAAGMARLLFVTHEATTGDVVATLDDLGGVPGVVRVANAVRILPWGRG